MDFLELEDGDELVMSFDDVGCGGRLLSIALPVRAGGFELASPPVLELQLDVGDTTLARVTNYALAFETLAEGFYEAPRPHMPEPELVDPCELDEQPGRLHGHLILPDGDVLEIDLEVTLEVPAALDLDLDCPVNANGALRDRKGGGPAKRGRPAEWPPYC